MKKDLTYSNAIEEIMLNNGYIAPLKLLYKEIWKYKDKSKIKGKTPFNTIQERVQRDKRFTKIGLGVYALTDYLSDLPKEVEAKTSKEIIERKHATIQGMLLEIGNFKKDVMDTYTNDKNWIFKGKRLGNLSTIKKLPYFTYKNIIEDSVRYIDVIWFNKRNFPYSIFEVEDSTDFRDALIKFSELQDFLAEFYCIAEDNRRTKFEKEIKKNAFASIRNRVIFRTYEEVESDYEQIRKKNYLL